MDLRVMGQATTNSASSIIIQTRHLLRGLLLLCVGVTTVQSLGVSVSTVLYGTIRLPCSFPFVHGPEGLTVVWEKLATNGSRVLIYKFMDSKDLLSDQDPQFTGRVELSKEFVWGNLDLTLREVTFKDEGTYICKAAHKKGDGDLPVDLTISGLDVTNPAIIFTYMDGDQYLLCLSSGMFRDLEVSWYDDRQIDLSRKATRNISDLGGGRKMVESILKMDAMPNRHYFCQIQEGRLNRKVHAVISDGDTPIYFYNIANSATWISPWKMLPGLLACTTIRIWSV